MEIWDKVVCIKDFYLLDYLVKDKNGMGVGDDIKPRLKIKKNTIFRIKNISSKEYGPGSGCEGVKVYYIGGYCFQEIPNLKYRFYVKEYFKLLKEN
jgi:hypothetical protein